MSLCLFALALLPPDLAAVSSDAAGFVAVRVRPVLAAEAFADVRAMMKEGPMDVLAASCDLGPPHLQLEHMVRAVVVWPAAEHLGANLIDVPPEARSRVVLLTYDRDFPRVPDRPKSSHLRTRRGVEYALDENGWTAICEIGPRTMAFGSKAAIDWLIDRRADRRPGPLTAAIRRAAHGPDPVVLAARPGLFQDKFKGWMPVTATALTPLFQADVLTVRAGFDGGFHVTATAELPDPASAVAAAVAVKAAAAISRAVLAEAADSLQQSVRESGPGAVLPGAAEGCRELAERVGPDRVSRAERMVTARVSLSRRAVAAMHPSPYMGLMYALTFHGGPQILTASGDPATPSGYRKRPSKPEGDR